MSRKGRAGARTRAARLRANAENRRTPTPAPGVRESSTTTTPAATPATGTPIAATTTLRSLADEVRRASAAVDAEVARLRAAGLGWPQIGAALGVTRQAARQRYG